MGGRVAIRRAGSSAVLIDCGDLERALETFGALARARENGELDVVDLVPAAETVLVAGGEARDAQRLAPKLRRLIEAGGGADRRGEPIPETVIPVHYTGEDLAEVAALTGLSVQQVVERHTAAAYTVAFTGFAPGFAYLSGGDPALAVPRRSTPRPRIQPGSVGLAGPFSGVYPRESPGGWQIIGFTELPMWDLDRDPPAALITGGTVRFVAERERAVGSGGASVPMPAARTPERTANRSPSLKVIDPGLQTLVEDAGRSGVSGMGVGESGAADRRAYGLANRLVGNRAGAAAVELGHGDFAVEALMPTVLAVSGAERIGRITGPYGTRTAPHATPFRLSAGERLTLGAPSRGLRTVLGVRGGVDAPVVLGSRSRDTLAGLGPEPLVAGGELAVADDAIRAVGVPEIGESRRLPAVGQETVLRVVLGPRDDWFDRAARDAFAHESWEVTPRSDRVGVRLTGAPVERAPEYLGRELPSEGMVLGAIQVPPDGQPVLFLADRPLTGGYPVIAVVHEDDIDLAAQLAPGCRVRFAPVAADLHDAAEQSPRMTNEQGKKP